MMFALKSYIYDLYFQVYAFINSSIFLILSPFFILFNLYKNKTFEQPKNIIITGACGGLGGQLATQYSKPGTVISLFGMNNDQLLTVQKKCIRKGATVEINVVNNSDRELLKKKLLDFDDRHPVDLLIANAGLIESQVPSELDLEEKTQRVVEVNVFGMMNTVLPLVPRLEQRRNGQICIISSLSSYIDFFYPGYSGSKSFCNAFALTLRRRLYEYGVGVTLVTPGFLDTPMSTTLKNSVKLTPVDEAVERIQNGLKINVAQVYFPYNTFLLTYCFNLVSPNLREPYSRFVSYLNQRATLHNSKFIKNN
ncbi:hypothetical protein DICPUDRAFT_159504 [Dictyostelium purpureum]|uniref:Uncharacterized protein n=1 Tax=Dictyostelium purpureum TaxID=5786 RepID=F1A4A5_DICPU|nr:uncharacterized protein DICPUDRAFT_159504 [Dictyostelium purpureum]EGC28979.1 hypothetical protein DICPUDRAFT_159504 [Dictyostelium purpureum]|eukprot:XP_003294499.1 hypothetical protein DICPUDRAFT_159504 [Dictyostelium purpureum]